MLIRHIGLFLENGSLKRAAGGLSFLPRTVRKIDNGGSCQRGQLQTTADNELEPLQPKQ